MRALALLLLSVSAAMLSACGGTVPESITRQTPARPVMAAPAPSSNGGIYQAAAYRPLFEDRRARLVGDIITITINEKTSAAKSSGASASKNGSVKASVDGLLGLSGGVLGRLSADASSANKYEDKGAASSSNNFSGAITVTVNEVLPNGYLSVSGEKQIAFDKGVEYVRFSGVVNPDTVVSGNIVSSTQVADARIEYRTSSRVDRAEVMSSLARFFYSVAPF
ncbi:flagellar L-ring protein precursor FlgH [Noviherbaspirillum humi]|uniref:Flagellar L-ring protein n=1 Tax=Noviherbaspirillum humi TaxID=1688639 RepID=A0A239FXZ8_9BURK|nr:flagellar basal body L-ring protein FlgH [Noviherbaspirillum humi]SNS61073.1 flagellar L-ring protein precursor FlgH [Noviherbaspirillum humi]